MAGLSAGTSSQIWDGVDFTQRGQKLLSYTPVLIVACAVLIHIGVVLLRAFRPSRVALDSTATAFENPLTSIENAVIRSTLAASLIPLTTDPKPSSRALDEDQADEIINEFKAQTSTSSTLERVGYVTSVVGALGQVAVYAAGWAMGFGDWKALVVPIYALLLSFHPHPPQPSLATVLSFHLPLPLLALRSAAIHPQPQALAIIIPTYAILYWLVVISLPYRDDLGGVLAGAKAGRGGWPTVAGGGGEASNLGEPSSILSRAMFSYLIPLVFKYYQKPITGAEVPAIREDDGSAASLGSWRTERAANAKKRERKLVWLLLWFFRRELAQQAIYTILYVTLAYLPPVAMQYLLKFIADRKADGAAERTPTHVAVLWVGLMVFGQIGTSVAMGQALVIGRRICIQSRSIIIGECMTKALRRVDRAGSTKASGADGKSAEPASEGKIVNLVAVDAFNISEMGAYLFYSLSIPIAILLDIYLLWRTLGLASLAGVMTLILLTPLQGLIGKLYASAQTRLLAATDARLETVTEVISQIRLLKYNSWESKFFAKMVESRKKELRVLRQRFAASVLQGVVMWGTPPLVTAVAFAVHTIWLKKPLTADTAFTSLTLFNMLRDPLASFTDVAVHMIQNYVSAERVAAFLGEEESMKNAQYSVPTNSDDPVIGCVHATFSHLSEQDALAISSPATAALTSEVANAGVTSATFKLEDVSLSFPVGELSIVTGPVGSGKTTLIMSLLGETTLLSGKVFMPNDHGNRDLCAIDPETGLSDTIAFCAQTPWLVGASIKENIVFGSDLDDVRYRAVISACALQRDLEIMELGDETEVGEKGTTCSGGQKARIALARALYSPAKTLVLDDVLSAVDAQTARHLYRNCLRGPLAHGRTIILVSHAVSLVLPGAAFAVVLNSGHVTASGTPEELRDAGHFSEESFAEDVVDSTVETSAAPSSAATLVHESITVEETLDEPTDKLVKQAEIDKAAKKLVQKESQAQGRISLKTYLMYFRALGNGPFWVLLVTVFIGSQALQIGNNAWLKAWANNADKISTQESAWDTRVYDLATGNRTMSEYPGKHHTTQYYLWVYCIITAAYLFAIAARITVLALGSLHASQHLYERAISRVLGARMRFFDSTPSGRIMNRLSADFRTLDQDSSEIVMYFASSVLACAATVVVVALATPAFLISGVGIVALYWVIGALYVAISRELKRIDSVNKSPIMNSFAEVLQGVTTVRAYGDAGRFTGNLLQQLDASNRAFWYLWQSNRLLSIYCALAGTLVTVFACVFALLDTTLDAGAVGLSISYSLAFNDFVLWIVRLYAALEMNMNSAERIFEYVDLEVEEEEHEKGSEPPAYWPTRDSTVEVRDLSCRYAPQLDPVLRGVSFTVGPREKIGICGRTGSGKSTLALCFFRFLEADGGSITIDGLDISKISLATLRSRLTILPQEAQLFTGTIRENLDPFSNYEDAELWAALIKCGLAGRATPSASRVASVQDLGALSNVVEAEPEEDKLVLIRSLEEKVAAGGKNFSQGQRQLLALARGLLKLSTSSFLIMDESTANLDHATDMAIQKVLRSEMADVQMLIVAHRLATVAGLDKVLVLDHGRVVEYDTPWNLLQKEDGVFRSLCRQSGEEDTLFEMAKAVHEGRL